MARENDRKAMQLKTRINVLEGYDHKGPRGARGQRGDEGEDGVKGEQGINGIKG